MFGITTIVGTIFLFDKEDIKKQGYLENGSIVFGLLVLLINYVPKWLVKLSLIIFGILLILLGVLELL